jgi:hypothetical protein
VKPEVLLLQLRTFGYSFQTVEKIELRFTASSRKDQIAVLSDFAFHALRCSGISTGQHRRQHRIREEVAGWTHLKSVGARVDGRRLAGQGEPAIER